MKNTNARNLPWPDNLVSLLLSDEEFDVWKARCPSDFDDALNYVLKTVLSDSEIAILYAYFRDNLKATKLFGPGASQTKNKAIQRLKHPSCVWLLKHGFLDHSAHNGMWLRNVDLKVRNALRRAGITTMRQLLSLSEGQLLTLRNIGTKAVSEIKDSLSLFGLELSKADNDLVYNQGAEPWWERQHYGGFQFPSPSREDIDQPESVLKCCKCDKPVIHLRKLIVENGSYGDVSWSAIPTTDCHVPFLEKPKRGCHACYCKRCFKELNK